MLLKQGLLFTPDATFVGDLRITNDRISEIAESLTPKPNETVIDLEGLWLWPGVIDGHVHFREPGPTYKEDWATGSKAAVAGGVTTVLEMPNTSPTTTTLEALYQKHELAAQKSLCNFGLFFGASVSNLDTANQCTDKVPGLKIFMGCSTGDLLVYKEEDLDPIFKGYKGLICVHAESELRLKERAAQFKDQTDDPAIHSVIRDPEAAREAVALACKLAVKYHRPLHILHLSTREELDELEKWRTKAPELAITCEVCPHHLFLDTDDYDTMGTLVRMNPPLRAAHQVEAMWEALLSGEIQMIATDHAPHTLEEKNKPYLEAPSGVPGVQTLLPLMLDAADRGLCSHEEVLRWLCYQPADIYGVTDRGRLKEGYYADIVVIDPEFTQVIRNEDQHSRCGWTPWAGRETTGWPVMTLVNGVCVYSMEEEGAFFHPDATGKNLFS